MKSSFFTFVHRLILLLPLLGLLGGCATTHNMSPKKDTQTLELKDKALILMSLQLEHDYKPKYQPDILRLRVESAEEASMGDVHQFIFDEDSQLKQGDDHTYMLRMELDPGRYVIRGVHGEIFSFPIHAFCFMPIHEDIEAKPNTVTYVGRVRGVTRKRKEGEFRSGALIPLLDQGVSGFAHSTFDVEVSDQRNEDLDLFQTNFPALTNVDIQVDVLPPFNRQRAQTWWDTDRRDDGTTGTKGVSAKSADQ